MPARINLVKLRDRLGWSQTDLARILGVHWMTISRWERGLKTPRAHETALIGAAELAVKRVPTIGRTVRDAFAARGYARALYRLLAAAYGSKR